MNTRGHIELERTLDSITVGNRHRIDLGDIDTLAASIEQHGLLQPITVTPEGVLVCGARRLAALRSLGVRKTNVWVRAGVTDRLGQVLAEQDDDALHKPLTPTETASLYQELKVLLAEDAARRQEASRFTTHKESRSPNGPATMAAPSTANGDARAQAAQFVTGRRSYTTLERIGELQRAAADPEVDPSVRARAQEELARIDDGAPVAPAHRRLASLLSEPDPDSVADTSRDADLEELATQAREHTGISAKRPERVGASQRHRVADADAKLPVRAFVYLWDDLRGWWEQYDSEDIAHGLTDAQWHQFEETISGTVAFAEVLRDARAPHGDTRRSRVGGAR